MDSPKCCRCGTTEDVSIDDDPIELTALRNEVKRWYCGDCLDILWRIVEMEDDEYGGENYD